MAFSLDMKQAAHRHFDAATTLDAGKKRPAAAYLYGLAAECAVKSLLKVQGVKTKPEQKDDPYYAHFPKLRALLSDAMQGRGAAMLEPFTKSTFLSDWDIVVRYATTGELVGTTALDKRYGRWQADAQSAINTMGEYT